MNISNNTYKLILPSLVFFILLSVPGISTCAYGGGDWIIAAGENCTNTSETITVIGYLEINETANLTLNNVTLEFNKNNGGYLDNYGGLYVYNDSTLSSGDGTAGKSPDIWLEYGSINSINDTAIFGLGGNWGYGLWINTTDSYFNNINFTDSWVYFYVDNLANNTQIIDSYMNITGKGVPIAGIQVLNNWNLRIDILNTEIYGSNDSVNQELCYYWENTSYVNAYLNDSLCSGVWKGHSFNSVRSEEIYIWDGAMEFIDGRTAHGIRPADFNFDYGAQNNYTRIHVTNATFNYSNVDVGVLGTFTNGQWVDFYIREYVDIYVNETGKCCNTPIEDAIIDIENCIDNGLGYICHVGGTGGDIQFLPYSSSNYSDLVTDSNGYIYDTIFNNIYWRNRYSSIASVSFNPMVNVSGHTFFGSKYGYTSVNISQNITQDVDLVVLSLTLIEGEIYLGIILIMSIVSLVFMYLSIKVKESEVLAPFFLLLCFAFVSLEIYILSIITDIASATEISNILLTAFNISIAITTFLVFYFVIILIAKNIDNIMNMLGKKRGR